MEKTLNMQNPFSPETAEHAKETVEHAKETVRSAVDDAGVWAKSQTERAKETLKAKAEDLSQQTRETKGRIVETLSGGREQAAGILDKAAAKVRDAGPRIPGGQQTTDMAFRAAEGLESTAGYLRRSDARAMASDVKETVRRYPTEALVGALITGFLVGRVLRSR